MIRRVFTAAQMAQCRAWRDDREATAHRFRARPQISDDTARFDTARANLVGIMGEFAFGLECDLPMIDVGVIDDGIDFAIPGFGTIDVKTSSRFMQLRGPFWIRTGKIMRADFGVNAEIENDRTVWLTGWIDRHSMYQEAETLPDGARRLYGPRLGRIELFIDRLRRRDPPYGRVDPCDTRPWPRVCP